jgi:protein-disulfide isomerase
MVRLCIALLCLSCACASRTKPTAAPAPALSQQEGPPKFPLSAHAGAQREAQVERIFQLPASERAPALGPAAAKVQLEVCSDFQCPYCAQLVPTLHELSENYGDFLHIQWRNCPLPFHEHALSAAEAALEVHAQRGSEAFWAYHDQLFSHQNTLDEESLVALARTIDGVDAERVRAALRDRRHRAHVGEELMALVESGAAAGGLGTPATFVNGRIIEGAQPYTVFEDAVERALQELPEARARAEADSQAAYPMAHVRHVLVQYAGAKAAEKSVVRSKVEAKARAEQLRQKVIEERIRFDKVAEEASDCPTAKAGGALGRFTRGQLDEQLDAALFALQPGQLSPVLETPFGYHVLLREE